MTFPKYLNLEDFISEDLEEVSIRLVAAEKRMIFMLFFLHEQL